MANKSILYLAISSWALISVNALPFVYDFTGKTHIGASTGLYYCTVNIAAATGPQLVGILIDVLGKNYRIIFVVSAIFMALAASLIARVSGRDEDLWPEPTNKHLPLKF